MPSPLAERETTKYDGQRLTYCRKPEEVVC